MRIRLSPDSRQPLSAQLATAIRRRIDDGRVRPGDRLPSVRRLAAELDLAPNTVARAYRTLEAEELLEGRGRHGTFVRVRPVEVSSEAASELREMADAFVETAERLGLGRQGARSAIHQAIERRWGRRS